MPLRQALRMKEIESRDSSSAPPDVSQARTPGMPTLAVVSGATMLALVIFTVPLTTLEPMARALGAGPGAQAWLLSAMPLGAATGLLAAGALGDNHGRRMVFLWGLAVMAIASAIGAVAGSQIVLIGARIAQGLGSAAALACGLGLIGQAFPDDRARTRATAIWAAALGAGVAAGPIYAAWMTAIAGWTTAYLGTGLIAAALLWAGWALLPKDGTSQNRRIDWIGTMLLMAGLALFMSGLTEMRLGLARPSVVALMCGGLALLVGFLFVEVRHHDPILDLSLFRSAGFAGATVAGFASGAGVLALMALVPMLLSRAMDIGALAAAFVLCAWSATSVITTLAAHWLPQRLSPCNLLLGGLLACAAAQLMLLGPDAHGTILRLLPGLLIAGAANGVLNAALGRQAVATVPPKSAAMGSGANNTARYLGSAIGITVGAVLMAHGAEVGGVSGLLAGWNEAVLVTAVFSVLGAIVVAVARDR